jgi:hypothetical protein
MRICPVGIAFRNATEEELHEAVRMAIVRYEGELLLSQFS